MLNPVAGYFWRMMVESTYRATDRGMLEWFSRFFRRDDRLRPDEAAKWVIFNCKYCNDIHISHLKKRDEELEYQKE